MKAKPSAQHIRPPIQTTRLVLRGTLVATLCLSFLIIAQRLIAESSWPSGYFIIAVISILYFLFAEYLLKHNQQAPVNWMLIGFYELLTLTALMIWGLGSPIGIITISFTVILPSILAGARFILPVAGLTILMLAVIQTFHDINLVKPNLESLAKPASLWDVGIYSTVLLVFALVSWLSSTQNEKVLSQILSSEAALQAQKDTLREDLEKESSARRNTELKQIRELYKFAILGQSAAATLHDLSNHLSVLNLDIDDISQQHSNSQAIANAKDSIEHINKTVQQARYQLNSYNQQQIFNALPAIRESINDIQDKFQCRNVKLTRLKGGSQRSFYVQGNPLALNQIISILLNNALEACYDSVAPEVTISVKQSPKNLIISISDNGPGVDPKIIKSLFKPVQSTKPSGMGVGLYISRYLAEDLFGGNIKLKPSQFGAVFVVNLPKKSDRDTSQPS